MDLELKDKVAIAGASKGLGRACAEVLAEEGAKVAICSRTQADLEQAAQEIRDATDTDVLTLPVISTNTRPFITRLLPQSPTSDVSISW